MALVVKITGGPTVFDATVVADTNISGNFIVIGKVYPDDHPMLQSANTAFWDANFNTADTTDVVPLAVNFGPVSVAGYKIQEAVDGTTYQLYPFHNQSLEDQVPDTNDGPFDPAG